MLGKKVFLYLVLAGADEPAESTEERLLVGVLATGLPDLPLGEPPPNRRRVDFFWHFVRFVDFDLLRLRSYSASGPGRTSVSSFSLHD